MQGGSMNMHPVEALEGRESWVPIAACDVPAEQTSQAVSLTAFTDARK